MGVGITGDIDLRYNLKDNLNLGLLLNGAILFRDMDAVTGTATISNNSCDLVVADYYFNDGTSSFAPFLGGGLGIHKVWNIRGTNFSISNFNDYTSEYVFGGMAQFGFEIEKIRLALQWYLIPKTKVVNVNNIQTGISSNNYMNLNIGFFLGGGNWKKQKKHSFIF